MLPADDIVKVAGRAMRQNFVQLGPHVLPLREQAKVLCNQFVMRLVSQAKKRSWPFADRLSVPQGYTPNFSKAVGVVCLLYVLVPLFHHAVLWLKTAETATHPQEERIGRCFPWDPSTPSHCGPNVFCEILGRLGDTWACLRR
ncbi:hypothetical protein AK812_SmicGene18225 [Symbiodinium microadriaticum]|uniref:FAE domain-containing protein n=1 Tax=Symbiodinium microadriaticum TaxID=2951 RepID=A0A1Q9DVQ5_SYMMI|nr:hypothetical protein AK812_SmicGene18225 [Symbiodinium microadriaticum]